MRRTEIQKVAAVVAAAITLFMTANTLHSAYAHSALAGSGATIKTIDKYQTALQLYPKFPSAGQNVTLHFTVLDDRDNSNVNGVYAAMVMKEKESGKIEAQVPYRFYELGDVSIDYKFQDNEDHVATLFTRVIGDPKYQANPLVADFDIPVGQTTTISLGELLIQVVPFTMALVGGLAFLFKKKNWGPQG
jgi:hypothetical protein